MLKLTLAWFVRGANLQRLSFMGDKVICYWLMAKIKSWALLAELWDVLADQLVLKVHQNCLLCFGTFVISIFCIARRIDLYFQKTFAVDARPHLITNPELRSGLPMYDP